MHIHDRNFEEFISEHSISQTVEKMGREITNDYHGGELVCLVVLKGSFVFAADLLRAIQLPCRVEFLSAKSYGTSMTTSGEVVMDLPDLNCRGKHILLIEDIVDTGLTISTLISSLAKHGATSLRVAALISKPEMRKIDVQVDYVGIEIPPVFIVGYGLDYAELGRNLPAIWALSE
ncbi:MAG: hypoxanthine phosphoribosyltransferase [Ignavibacteria bacterium]|nr:hypoxanthine phosphoribosyltransferase [Ignavibacteria bacterium]